MATELSRELFPDDILWFLQDMEHETIDEVDTLTRQIEIYTDEQPLGSTQQADSVSGDNFANADSVELKRLHDLNFNKNTKRSTNSWVNRFDSWRVSREVPWKLEDIPLSNFDEVLQRFFAELKTRKGEEYEPDSWRTMLGALNRHLRDSGCAHRINDEQFLGVLNGKAIDLREKGKGKKKRKADPITDEEEEQMWAAKVLGSESPRSLNFTVW